MTAPLRALHVPGDHDYVAHLGDDRVPGVEVVRDDDGAPAAGWRPSPALDAAWVTANADRFDVLHLHFGFEGRTPEQLRALVAAVHGAGRRLVLTVHDLQNPHLHEQARFDELLDVLVPAADALVTLTPGAAAEVRARWGRDCVVVPHPHVAPLAEVGRPRPARSPRVVGLHLKSLRANLVALPVLTVLADAVAGSPGTVLRVDVHDEALDPAFGRHDAELVAWLHEAAAAGRVDLRVHGRFDDAGLRAYLRELDVSVLAYGHGTHSGWLELCHDLGVPVLAGRVGYLHQQQALVEVDLHDPSAVAAGLARALGDLPGSAATAAGRLAQRLDVATAHRDLYRRVLAAAPDTEAVTEAVAGRQG
ncbi:glycosyltransferase [Kineococcus rubinsiae]|uniref:glycosyltransferase n=1 Tax=Kineococcus rubinsiae TaxID=2609562 RepID=UPI00142F9D91|nr:glycosyltransferase [Kineococcus rubinsiae]NIZ90549.1 glycosyltransferase [Kineococcus rubinsiae]